LRSQRPRRNEMGRKVRLIYGRGMLHAQRASGSLAGLAGRCQFASGSLTSRLRR
jgi:hypothetical protein